MYKDSITSLKLQHQKDIVNLKAKHMEKMVEVKEEYAKNQELYLQQRATNYEATIGRQHEYIEKLHSEKEALNKSVSELRDSVNSLTSITIYGSPKQAEREIASPLTHKRSLSNFKTPQRSEGST